MTDPEILKGLAAGGTAQDRVLEHLYHHPAYRKAARQTAAKFRAMRLEGWEGIFHESLVDFTKRLKTDAKAVNGELIHYFRGICLNKCRELHRKESKERPAEEGDNPRLIQRVASPVDEMVSEERKELLRQVLKRLPAKCQTIFKLWAQSYAMREIAEQLDLKGERTAITYKSRCKKQLLQLLEEEPAIRQLLKHYR